MSKKHDLHIFNICFLPEFYIIIIGIVYLSLGIYCYYYKTVFDNYFLRFGLISIFILSCII